MVTASFLAELRHAGFTVEIDGERVAIRGPRRLAPLARQAATRREDLREALERERAAWVRLRAELDYADRCEAAARARGETVPEPDDPTADYWAWIATQPAPPPVPGDPAPRLIVAVDMASVGRLVSGPLLDATTGAEVAP